MAGNIKLNLKADKRLPLILHILAWIIILLLPIYLSNISGDREMGFLRHYYLNTTFYGIFFYTHYLRLVPRLYFREKRGLYFMVLILIMGAFAFLLWFMNDLIREIPDHAGTLGVGAEDSGRGPGRKPPPFRGIFILNHLWTLILLTGFSLGLGVLDRYRRNEKEKKDMEREMLNAELALLKNQVSPHFFFNTLNNIYSLIQFDSKKAGETVHKLSKLMRYLLYDSDKSLTALADEIQFMRNYIELMQLRLNKKIRLKVDLPEEPPSIELPPLLFIPVIENAFKHGVSYRESSFIDIAMEIRGDEIHFQVRNSQVKGSQESHDEHSGIGLENVRKRLNLLFPANHELRVIPGQSDYLVKIMVNIKDLKT